MLFNFELEHQKYKNNFKIEYLLFINLTKLFIVISASKLVQPKR